MPKRRTVKDLQIGDVFYTTFVNQDGDVVTPAHPFIVIQNQDQVQILDASAIIGAFSMTDIHSKHGEELKQALSEGYYNIAKVLHKKESIIDISSYYLFNDQLPNDKPLKNLNVSQMFSEEKTKELLDAHIALVMEDKAHIVKSNLKVSIVDGQQTKEVKPLSR